jgi:hypothetical protein
VRRNRHGCIVRAIAEQVDIERAAVTAMPVRLGRQRWLTSASGVFDQLWVLTSSDLRARYGRGRWQLVKWLIDPFALVGVYLLLVTFIFYRRPHAVGLALGA